jgi:hypothetical protein
MDKGMNRREFLRASAATGVALMVGDLLGKGPVAYGAVQIPEA